MPEPVPDIVVALPSRSFAATARPGCAVVSPCFGFLALLAFSGVDDLVLPGR